MSNRARVQYSIFSDSRSTWLFFVQASCSAFIRIVEWTTRETSILSCNQLVLVTEMPNLIWSTCKTLLFLAVNNEKGYGQLYLPFLGTYQEVYKLSCSSYDKIQRITFPSWKISKQNQLGSVNYSRLNIQGQIVEKQSSAHISLIPTPVITAPPYPDNWSKGSLLYFRVKASVVLFKFFWSESLLPVHSPGRKEQSFCPWPWRILLLQPFCHA